MKNLVLQPVADIISFPIRVDNAGHQEPFARHPRRLFRFFKQPLIGQRERQMEVQKFMRVVAYVCASAFDGVWLCGSGAEPV